MKHFSSPFAVCAAVLLGSACAHPAALAPVSPAPAEAESLAAAPALPPDTAAFLPGPAAPPVALTLREKAAQLVMPWIPGEYWATDAAAFTAALQQVDEGVGGFIVGVGSSPYDIAEKLNALQRAARVPLLIASDFESGPGARIREAPAFPGNMALGATDRELDAYEVGRVIAVEARAVGIQFDFAPVVDVNNNPQNPIINVRSFGENPQRVAVLGSAFIRGLREHGMLSAAKHFPGHGDTGTDSHIALPIITATRARLDSVELVPFRAAVREGTDAVMTAHLAIAGLAGEGSPPATLSPFILDTLLRQDLGFRGLVVTDALNMGAIVSRYGASQAAVLALQAGADILLMPADPKGAIDAIVDAVGRGQVSEARLDSSVARVLAAKARVGLFDGRLVDVNRIAAAVGDSADVALDQDISQRSLVLVKDSLGLVPLPAARRRHVLVVSYGNEAYRDVGGTFTGGDPERPGHAAHLPAVARLRAGVARFGARRRGARQRGRLPRRIPADGVAARRGGDPRPDRRPGGFARRRRRPRDRRVAGQSLRPRAAQRRPGVRRRVERHRVHRARAGPRVPGDGPDHGQAARHPAAVPGRHGALPQRTHGAWRPPPAPAGSRAPGR